MPNATPTLATQPPKYIIQKTVYLKLFLKLTNMSTPSSKKKILKKWRIVNWVSRLILILVSVLRPAAVLELFFQNLKPTVQIISSWPANPNQNCPKTKTKQHWHITIDRHTLLSTNYQLESKDLAYQHRTSLLSE